MRYATLQDIAAATHKSVATVSRVLAGKDQAAIPIGAETKRLVLETARHLNYRPNLNARHLLGQASRVIGLVVPDIMQSYFNELCSYLSRELNAAGFDLILAHSFEDPRHEREAIEMLLSRRVAGIILAPAAGRDNLAFLRTIRDGQVPLVLIDRYFGDEPFLSVSTDDVAGERLLIRHLLAQGARRILFIAGQRDTSVTIERIEGYRQAHAEYGLAVDERLIVASGYLLEDGLAAIRTPRLRLQGIDAAVGVNDAVALGALAALEDRGLIIPEKLLLAGYADDRYAPYFKVPLTTVRQPRAQIARHAFTLLMDALNETPIATRRHKIACELVVRRSTQRETTP